MPFLSSETNASAVFARPVRNTVEMFTPFACSVLRMCVPNCVFSHLRNHLRSAAETRHCGCHIGRRTARDTLKLHDLIKCTAALLRHENQ